MSAMSMSLGRSLLNQARYLKEEDFVFMHRRSPALGIILANLSERCGQKEH
jgi:hypothetical protein